MLRSRLLTPLASSSLLGLLLALVSCAPGVSPVSPVAAIDETGAPKTGPLDAAEMDLLKKLTKAKTCETCHKHDERKGLMDAPGFLHTAKNLPARLEPEAYSRVAEALKKNDMKRYEASKGILDKILGTADNKDRMRLWLTAYLKDPKFDSPKNKMARVALSEGEIALLVRYLVHLNDGPVADKKAASQPK